MESKDTLAEALEEAARTGEAFVAARDALVQRATSSTADLDHEACYEWLFRLPTVVVEQRYEAVDRYFRALEGTLRFLDVTLDGIDRGGGAVDVWAANATYQGALEKCVQLYPSRETIKADLERVSLSFGEDHRNAAAAAGKAPGLAWAALERDLGSGEDPVALGGALVVWLRTVHHFIALDLHIVEELRRRLEAVLLARHQATGNAVERIPEAPAEPAPRATPPAARVFCKREVGWEVRFDGEQGVLPDCLGLGYLATLLANPTRTYAPWELSGDIAPTGGGPIRTSFWTARRRPK